jgi:hypothetical protein
MVVRDQNVADDPVYQSIFGVVVDNMEGGTK